MLLHRAAAALVSPVGVEPTELIERVSTNIRGDEKGSPAMFHTGLKKRVGWSANRPREPRPTRISKRLASASLSTTKNRPLSSFSGPNPLVFSAVVRVILAHLGPVSGLEIGFNFGAMLWFLGLKTSPKSDLPIHSDYTLCRAAVNDRSVVRVDVSKVSLKW